VNGEATLNKLANGWNKGVVAGPYDYFVKSFARLLKNLGMGLLRRGYCGVLAVYERTIVLPIVKRVETFN
jgi:hypothetical protein